MVATKERTTVICDLLTLTNVLYVPNLHCNLISVSQLLDNSNCIVQFTNKMCTIQDRTSRMLISMGEQREGLYYFQGMGTVAAMQIGGGSSFDLWHKKLRHPSSKVVEILPNIGSSINSSMFSRTCDVCLRAKQTRESFPINNNKSLEIFQLIHCDLLGPYRTPAHCGSRYFLTIVDDYSKAV